MSQSLESYRSELVKNAEMREWVNTLNLEQLLDASIKCYDAVKKTATAFKYIKNPTETVQLAAVQSKSNLTEKLTLFYF